MSGRLVGRRITSTLADVVQPGDYLGPVTGWTGDKLAMFFIPPGADVDPHYPHGRLHHVTFPPHTFRECADGSLEVRASIGCHRHDGEPGYMWHGYLDEGHVWREC